MLWLIFTLLAVIFGGFIGLIHRSVLKAHDFISYGFFFQILGALFYIPLLLFYFKIPIESFAWVILLAGTAMWTVTSVVTFKSYQHIEVSLRAPLYQTRAFFLLMLSYFLLSEAMTIPKIGGVIAIVIGAIILTFERGKKFGKLTEFGVRLTILSALLVAIVSIVDKVAMNYWTPAMYGFFVYMVPGSILGGFTLRRTRKFIKMIRLKLWIIVLAVILDILAYFFLLNAYFLTEVSNVYPIAQLSLMIAVIGGIVLLKERKNIIQKIIGAMIMIIGAIFVSGVV